MTPDTLRALCEQATPGPWGCFQLHAVSGSYKASPPNTGAWEHPMVPHGRCWKCNEAEMPCPTIVRTARGDTHLEPVEMGTTLGDWINTPRGEDVVRAVGYEVDGPPFKVEDQRYIAACSPDLIAKLADLWEAAQREVATGYQALPGAAWKDMAAALAALQEEAE